MKKEKGPPAKEISELQSKRSGVYFQENGKKSRATEASEGDQEKRH